MLPSPFFMAIPGFEPEGEGLASVKFKSSLRWDSSFPFRWAVAEGARAVGGCSGFGALWSHAVNFSSTLNSRQRGSFAAVGSGRLPATGVISAAPRFLPVGRWR